MSNAGKTQGVTGTTATEEKTKRTRKASGPRKAQPVYVFVSVGEDRKVSVNKVTKNAKDIAKWVAEGGVTDTNNQLITVEIPATSAEPTANVGTGS